MSRRIPRVARARPQIDLYEKRYCTFNATMMLLAHVGARAIAPPEAVRELAIATTDAALRSACSLAASTRTIACVLPGATRFVAYAFRGRGRYDRAECADPASSPLSN